MKSKHVIVLFISIVMMSVNVLNAQSLKLNPKTFSMTILGTTNVHNFESKATQASGELVINSSKQVQTMIIEIPVKGIKSNEKLMDTKTYEAFNADKYPTITFKLTDASSLQVNGNDISVTAIGNLTIAGVTRKVVLKSVGKVIKPGVYKFEGSYSLKMTDYKMTPPTAMMGMMKVGDGITLKYSVTFEGPAIN
ncbi:MAG: YceI family protein [Paludibacter sp.]|nr:YceI family protein [Paludibacter sp.]